jgi:Zn-dependent protease with chaperone function
LLSVLLPWAAKLSVTRVAPSIAARAVAMAAAVAAVASLCCLTLLALTLFDDVPPLSALDDRPELSLPKPVPGWIALCALGLLATGVARLAWGVRRRRLFLRRICRIGRPAAGLVVADWDQPYAIAVPGRPGHIVTTSGMLRLLDGDERRVLFAHENSHLLRHHHRLVAVASWAGAVNPLLLPMATLVSHLVERWADEDAAAEVGDRALVARAVAKASLATAGHRLAGALGLAGTGSVHRVMALVHPRLPGQGVKLAAIATLTLCVLLATAVAVVEFVEVAHEWLTFTG